MIAVWFASWCLAAEPLPMVWPSGMGPSVDARLGGKDPRDAKGLFYDAYEVRADAGVWVEATVVGADFPLRVRVGDETASFEAWQADGAVVRGWSTGEPVLVEVGAREEGLVGPYTLSIALIRPSSSEPPTGDKLPPYVVVEPADWAVDGWFCELVNARFADATTSTVSATAEDAARLRLLSGRWVDGALWVEAWGEPGARRSGPLEVPFEAGVPRVFGACRDRLGTAYLEVRTPDAHVVPGAVIDPSRRPATRSEAAAAVQADFERRFAVVAVEQGQANRYDAFVVPMFLQSGFDYEVVALTESDALVATAKLYFGYCDAVCEGFVAASGGSLPKDGIYTVVELPALDEPQAFAPTRTAHWRLAWPEGTTLTAFLRVYVGAIATQGVTVVIGEE